MVKHEILLLGNAHISGSSQGPRFFGPGGTSLLAQPFTTMPTGFVAGSQGVVLLEYDGTTSVGTPFVKDRIITSSPGGAKGRVLKDLGGTLVVEILSADLAASIPFKAFRVGDLVTDNTNTMTGGANKTATIGISSALGIYHEHNVKTTNAFSANAQWNAFTANPLLMQAVPLGLTANVYWDRAAKRMRNITVTLTQGDVAIWTHVTSSSGGKAMIGSVGGTSESRVLGLVDVQGTFLNGDTITNPSGSFGATLTIGASVPADGDTVTIGATTYTWKNTLSAANHVKIGATVADCCTNMKSAINAEPGFAGVRYGTGTTNNASCIAQRATATTVVVMTVPPNTATALAESGAQTSWSSSNTVAPAGTQSGAMNTPAAGNLVPYCPLPNLMGVGFDWDVPPGGDGVDGEALTGCGVGILPPIANRGYSRWATDLCIYRNESATRFGTTRGGMAYGFLPLQGTAPTTWVLGETITKTSGGDPWSAKVQAVEEGTGGAGGVWVSHVSGVLAAGATVQGAQSAVSATTGDNVHGWMKGAKYWQDAFAGGADHAAFVTAVGSTPTAEMVFAFGWEGDVALPLKAAVNGFTSHSQSLPVALGSHEATTVGLWGTWVDDVRTQLVAPEAAVLWFVHDLRSQQNNRPGNSILLRNAARRLCAQKTRVKPILADGYELPVAAVAGGPSYATDTQMLSLQTYDYLDVGKRGWSAFEQAVAEIPAGVIDAAALVAEGGQSQFQTVSLGFLLSEKNNEITRLPVNPISGQYPTYNLLDNRFWTWNFQTRAWEVADASVNLGGLNPGTIGLSGCELSLFPRVLQRVGGMFLFKPTYNGASSDHRCRNAPCTFDVTPYSRLQASGAINVVIGSGFATFESTPGKFTGWQAGEWVEIAGSTAFVGAMGGGNNTMVLNPLFISAVAVNGSSITVLGIGFKAGVEALTLTQGPIALKPIIEEHWREAHVALVSILGRSPRPLFWVWDQAEGNMDQAGDYAEKAGDVIEWLDDLLAPAIKGDVLTPLAVQLLHTKSPFGNASSRALMRAQQQALVSTRGRAVTVETGDLPLEPGPNWPPTLPNNGSYGVHRTPSAEIALGYRTDDALNSMLPARDLAVL